jgi:hypothetical protein
VVRTRATPRRVFHPENGIRFTGKPRVLQRTVAMMNDHFVVWRSVIAAALLLVAGPALAAREAASVPDQPQHQHPPPKRTPQPPPKPTQPEHEQMTPTQGWHLMQDAVLFGTFNRQGSPRGETEFKAQNWWMGVWSRQLSRGNLQLNAMLSLDPATVGRRGYSEIFQVGEAVDDRPLIDRQHPHDLVMQLAAVWRRPLTDRTTLTLAGGPIGEPALGPVAFMHRASAAENPTSPLGHHTMDSTHIAMGVITAAVERGPWTIETSLFNGREPDENRWDIMDPGALDSWAARLWVRPRAEWELQISHGFLQDPEELEPGNVRRTTASAGWMRKADRDLSAVTVVFGRNDKEHGAFYGLLTEATHHVGLNSLYGRLETQQIETTLLQTGAVPIDHLLAEQKDTVVAFTSGVVRDIYRIRGMEIGLGGDVTFYGVPDSLKATYGSSPISFHVFLRVRPPASAMGRMWNMTMTRPMEHGDMAKGHGMHRRTRP